MYLSKEQSGIRWCEARKLWCEWDPIGVMSLPSWPENEYDAYLGTTLRLLENGAPIEQLVSYLAEVELWHMGLTDTEQAHTRRTKFAAELKQWFASCWSGTHV